MKRQKKPYHQFAQFYDQAMGDRRSDVRVIKSLITRFAPRATSLVDIACGTGVITKSLSKKYNTFGIDASPEMLRHARRTLPKAKLVCCDMRSFRLPIQVDVALCAFDSINHLEKWADWVAMFRSVKNNLNDGGVFIFDINTVGRLQNLAKGRPWFHAINPQDHLMMTVKKLSPSRVEWDVKVFVHERNDRYRVVREAIKQTSFPIERIRKELLRHFSEVKILDLEGNIARKDAGQRLYFVARTDS